MNNINVLDEKLSKKGYEKSSIEMRKKTTTYYSSEKYSKYLAITSDDIPVLLEGKIFNRIKGRNTCMVSKRAGEDMSMPCIYTPKTLYLHQVLRLIPEDFEGDHRNHNRLDCTEENIRVCEHWQNAENRRCKLPVPQKTKDGWYCFKDTIYRDSKRLNTLNRRGYSVQYQLDFPNPDWCLIKSSHFSYLNDCCQEARWFNDFKYGEFAYCPENDFEDKMSDFVDGNIGEGTALLIRHKILQEISYEEMIELNKQRLANEMYNGVPLTHYMN